MNYTTQEESKTLIELGIDQDTSDLVYIPNLSYPSVLPGVKFSVIKEKLELKYPELKDAIIPAWTTDALIELLPTLIDDKYQLLIFPDITTKMWVCMYDEKEKHSKVLEACGDQEYRKAVLKILKWWLKEKRD